MSSQLIEYIFGTLKADSEILSVIREERPWKEAISSFVWTAVACLLINIPISYFGYKSTTSLTDELLAMLPKYSTFGQYLMDNLWSLFWPIIVLLVAWVGFSIIFHILAKGFKSETDFLTFLSFSGFLLPFEILFCLAYLIFLVGGYLQSVIPIFASFALGLIFFTWFARSLIFGAAVIYDFEKSKAAYVFLVLLVLMGAVISGGYYFIRP